MVECNCECAHHLERVLLEVISSQQFYLFQFLSPVLSSLFSPFFFLSFDFISLSQNFLNHRSIAFLQSHFFSVSFLFTIYLLLPFSLFYPLSSPLEFRLILIDFPAESLSIYFSCYLSLSLSLSLAIFSLSCIFFFPPISFSPFRPIFPLSLSLKPAVFFFPPPQFYFFSLT